MGRKRTDGGFKPAWNLAERLSRRLCSLCSEELCAAAQRRTGLTDFGPAALEPALSILSRSLDAEADLHPLGRFFMRTHLQGLLENRLRLEDLWKRERKWLDIASIDRPVFIVGMPRSGSTFLHELLAEDPQNRSPRVWEVMFPLAASSRNHRDKARAIRKAEICLWWFRRFAPRADEVYPMRSLTPHECVAIHSHTFLSEEFVSTCRVPAYETFLHATDLTPAYEWQRRFLQHLQFAGPLKRWVLKSPDHVYGLEKLFSIFPDAIIVQTHRNPLEVLKSSADLTWVLRGLYGRPGNWEEIHAREARVLAEGTECFIKFRDTHPELAARFIDVKYTDLVADPVPAVRKIYEQLDNPLTELAAGRMQDLASKRSRYRGRRASDESSRLKPEVVLETNRFERYCVRFGLSFQGAEFRR